MDMTPPRLRHQRAIVGPGSSASTQLSDLSESVKPANERMIVVELEKLRAVFGYNEDSWRIALPLYIEALGDLPYDLLRDAVANAIRMAGPQDRFPKPGT